MNDVISDILGKSGMAILDAIINHEERDAEVLSQLTDPRIKADSETIIKSLEANWRDEHLFELRQYYELYQIYQEKIKNLDAEIERILVDMQMVSSGEVVNQKIAKKTI